jgi:integrase
MSTTRNNRYQEGSIDRVARAKGPDVWVYRWRELQEDGTRPQRKRTIGDVKRFPKKADVKREVENLRSEINAQQERVGKTTVADAWGHFQLHELRDPDVDRSPTTVKSYLDYFKVQILPHWKDVPLDEVKFVAVEKWLRSLDLANGTKAKIRNHMSALFSHCIRHELYDKLNPIASVRQSAVRQRDPDYLTLEEMTGIVAGIESPVVRVMVATAAASALRRSEIRGLRWADLDFDKLWFNLSRGLVHKDETKLKTKASRKGVPMMPELAEMLQVWRTQTPYPTDNDWVFASPFTEGERPYWPDSVLNNHVRPAATAARITKTIGWHTFRHSVGSHLGQSGENVKVVQELLRHASSRITQDVYQQADQRAKRTALGRFSGVLSFPAKKTA